MKIFTTSDFDCPGLPGDPAAIHTASHLPRTSIASDFHWFNTDISRSSSSACFRHSSRMRSVFVQPTKRALIASARSWTARAASFRYSLSIFSVCGSFQVVRKSHNKTVMPIPTRRAVLARSTSMAGRAGIARRSVENLPTPLLAIPRSHHGQPTRETFRDLRLGIFSRFSRLGNRIAPAP